MNLYAESSAVLAWLLDEAAGTFVRHTLSQTEIVVASDLTLIECDRILLRASALGDLTEAEAADRRAHMATARAHRRMLRLGSEVVDRARQPFPGEPDEDLRCRSPLLRARCAIGRRRARASQPRRAHPHGRPEARSDTVARRRAIALPEAFLRLSALSLFADVDSSAERWFVDTFASIPTPRSATPGESRSRYLEAGREGGRRAPAGPDRQWW